jgi:hypothetical protein
MKIPNLQKPKINPTRLANSYYHGMKAMLMCRFPKVKPNHAL